ncbi:hypothetical protein [Lentibacillus jeotgali]|uniref:hypothetical protein n=1 Tax=Lentibacillus jeotgali TaxID=558169 RepID=UPI0002628C19|nr:hypothetical protein [Lentibacillus jeotgali]
MKKFIIFALSFIVLFVLFQILSGLILTYVYTPDIEEAWNLSAALSRETEINSSSSSFLITFFIALLSATIAYFIPKKF